MEAVLLAAGRGKRLRPLTDVVPKPLLPCHPLSLIARNISVLAALGVTRVVVVVHHLARMVKAALGSGEDYGLTLTYVDQGTPAGTAHAVSVASREVRGEEFLLLFSDVLIPPDAIRSLMESSPPAVVGARVPDPWNYGCLDLDGPFMRRVVEKPSRGSEPSDLVLAGAYLLDARVADACRDVPPSPRGEYELTDALNAVAATRPISVITADYWIDAGRPPDLMKSLQLLLDEARQGVWSPGDGLYPDEPVYIHPSSEALGYISPYSAVGPSSYVAPTARVIRSCLVSDVRILEGSEVSWIFACPGFTAPPGSILAGTSSSPRILTPSWRGS